MILLHSTSSLTLLDTLHMLTLGINLVSLGIIQCKEIVVRSWKRELIISKNSNDLFLAILGGSSRTLYQIQCADLNISSAYLAEKTMSMCL